jgi:hypothetical protein
MKSQFLFGLVLLVSPFSFSQIVINELDCDTSQTIDTVVDNIDKHEFLELLSETPNFPLDGYVVVFFNGSISGGNTSYFTIDLDGYTTDINGLFLIGNNAVSPLPQYIISDNTIQNGPDAVAIYQANDIDFPDTTLATINNLVDVLMYDTNDADDTDMINIFNQDPRFASLQQISEGPANNMNSIQRDSSDGSYFVGSPTPRQLNDGSGIVLNGITISFTQTQYNEGDVFDITFTTEQNVSEDLNFNFSLANGGFNTSDYTGTNTVIIPNGQKSAVTTITLVDDTLDEGDEVLKLVISTIPSQYLLLNNNLKIRIVDNDFVVAAWGTPVTPTYGVVPSTQPTGYYDSLDGLSGANLEQALQNIIAEEGVVRAQTYADIIDILEAADQNPANSNQVWQVYVEEGRPKLDYQTTSNNIGTWNREHTFPRSRGGFNSIDLDDMRDGKEVFWNTNADSLRHGNSDAHALRASYGPENSIRNNQFYGPGEYVGPSGTLGSFKGDVARSVLYMQIRYNGLQVVNGYPDGLTGQFGDLATLLEWHRNDPPDDYEMRRNNVVYTWQFNRNPFIDEPELVEYLWGTHVGDIWSQSLSLSDNYETQIKVFPNPSHDGFYLKGIQNKTVLDLYSIDGRKIKSFKVYQDTYIDYSLSAGMYLLKITSDGLSSIKKIVIE